MPCTNGRKPDRPLCCRDQPSQAWPKQVPEASEIAFIYRLLDGQTMAPLRREFGISRKTGYEICNRYEDCGVETLMDRSRRPYRHANQRPVAIERIVSLKHVSGMRCKPCDRFTPFRFWRARRDSNSRPPGS